MNEIDKLAWLHTKDQKILVVRSRGKDIFYMPGGKREKGESDQAALMREIREELSVDLLPETIKFAGTFIGDAHGQPNDTKVKLTCYYADYVGKIEASAEIAEFNWFHYDEQEHCSHPTRLIMNWLKASESKKHVTNQDQGAL